ILDSQLRIAACSLPVSLGAGRRSGAIKVLDAERDVAGVPSAYHRDSYMNHESDSTRKMDMSYARQENGQLRQGAPDVYYTVVALCQLAAKAGLDKQLLELVKLRASQINGCAFCVQYRILQAERLGVSVDKLNLLVVWPEAPQFSKRERAALAWTEALTV